jgi:hypothetical protein
MSQRTSSVDNIRMGWAYPIPKRRNLPTTLPEWPLRWRGAVRGQVGKRCDQRCEPAANGGMCDLAGALADHLKEVTWGGIYEGLRPNANCGDRFIATRDRPDESCPVRILPDVDLVHIYADPLQLGSKSPAIGAARPPEEGHLWGGRSHGQYNPRLSPILPARRIAGQL